MAIIDVLRQARASESLKGFNEVQANLNKEILAIKNRTMKGLIRAQIIIRRDMELSAPKIPVDTGNLRSSYFTVTSTGRIEAGGAASFRGDDAGKLAANHQAVINSNKSAAAQKKMPSLIMGFSAFYAWYVHEMVGAHFGREGAGAKFFESALKRNSSLILKVIAQEARIPK